MLEFLSKYRPGYKGLFKLRKDFFDMILDEISLNFRGGVRGKRVVEIVISRRVSGSGYFGREAGNEWLVKRGRRES